MPVLCSNDTWPDLILHVLAHVAGTADLPASVYDPAYVAFAARHLGPAGARTLAEDAAALAVLLPSHAALARAQLVAWLFPSPEAAGACAERDLGELAREPPAEIACRAALATLASAPALELSGLELLRCAALLEAPSHAALPPAVLEAEERARLAEALDALVPVAPWLARVDVVPHRALRLRGRVRRRTLARSPGSHALAEIWTGLPCDDPGPDVAHVAWQAAHEASVLEVTRVAEHAAGPAAGERAVEHAAGPAAGERAVEHAAVVLLAERAEEAGRAAERAAWYAHFGPDAPHVSRARLAPAEAELVARCRAAPGSP
ncbi:MAG: hypothetical protein IT373_27640 [Polyangiaceae bacterium]|nr:hypothetical protein [Polyangiaceae bacterium]